MVRSQNSERLCEGCVKEGSLAIIFIILNGMSQQLLIFCLTVLKKQAELGIGFPVVKEKKANIACSREEYQVNVPVKRFSTRQKMDLVTNQVFTFKVELDGLIL